MKKLSYATLKEQGYDGYLLESAPERVLQFGEGNFLRAFVDYFIDELNEKAGFNSKVVLCQPIAPDLDDRFNEQEGLYTLFLRGFQDGKKVNKKRVISCVSRCLNPYKDFEAVLACADNPDLRFIACNTTELLMILPVSLMMFRLVAILENLLSLCIVVSRNSVRKPAKDLSFSPVS